MPLLLYWNEVAALEAGERVLDGVIVG